jgi:hypothetical protein
MLGEYANAIWNIYDNSLAAYQQSQQYGLQQAVSLAQLQANSWAQETSPEAARELDERWRFEWKIEPLIDRGYRLLVIIAFWTGVPIIGPFVASILADRLDRITDQIET